MANDTFVMSARQSAELDFAFERNGWTAGDVKWLSEGDNLKGFLAVRRGDAKVVPMSLMRFVGTTTIPARTTRFVPGDHFVVNTTEDAHVKISYVDPDFVRLFGKKIEGPTAETTLRYYKFSRSATFVSAIQELSNEVVVKTTPGELYAMMEAQPNGPKSVAGPLFVNGSAQLFEMEDLNGVSRLMDVRWYGRGWSMYIRSVVSFNQWHDENQVFSHDSR